MLVLASLVFVAGVGAAPSGAESAVANLGPLEARSSVDVLTHLESLQAIADSNGGNRAFDTPGYQASVDYVAGRLQAAGYSVSAAPFTVADAPVEVGPPSFERTTPTGRVYAEGTDYDLPSPGAPTDRTGPVVEVAGCEEADYAAVPAGAIVLADLASGCDPWFQILFATWADAGGILLAPGAGPGAPPEHVDPGSLPFKDDVAVLGVSGDVAAEMRALLVADPVSVTIHSGWTAGAVTSTNVVAELPGASDEVVMLGAHLDSVPEGPGINDDGSGAAAMLAIAESLAASGVGLDRTVRFAFWGAEEIGLLGSTAYVQGLSPAERSRIVAYLNADMIGSPNFVRGVYDPAAASPDAPVTAAPGSAAITARFDSYFASLGLPTVPISTDGASDDASFAAAGIPTGGLFTGAFMVKTPEQVALFGGTEGAPYDPCYHLACDRISNVDVDEAVRNTEAILAVAVDLAGVRAVAEPIPVAPSFTG